MSKLTKNQWTTLDIQCQAMLDKDEYHSPDNTRVSMGMLGRVIGQHYLLASILNELGFYPRSSREALSIADRLLIDGYEQEDINCDFGFH